MRHLILVVAAATMSILAVHSAEAASEAQFPQEWAAWPVHRTGAIPANDAVLPSDLPAIVVETVKTYNWINDGKGSAYNIRVNPAAMDAIASGGEFPDGPTAVMELTDIKVLLVTEHLLGEPLYGAYGIDGKDLSEAHPSLAPEVCKTCHSGYGEACVQGMCTKK